MVSETTPLTSGEESRTYLFLSQRRRNRRTKIRQFQCCVCAAILGIFVTAMVVTVSYSMNHDTEDNGLDNATDANANSPAAPDDLPVVPNQLNVLLAQTWPLPDMSKQAWKAPTPTDLEVAAAIEEGEASLKAKDQLEARAELPNVSGGTPGILKLGTPSYTHQQAVKTTQQATDAARVGYVIGVATKKLASKTGNMKGSVGQGPPVHAFSMQTGMTCPDYDSDSWKKPTVKADCPPSAYRTIDGTCNNLVHADWGVTMRPFRRMLPPDYADGVSEPRVASDGTSLPSARDVSLTVHRPVYRNDPNFTVMLAVWGQFFDHDITATALSKSKDGASIACCTEDGRLPPKQIHPECYPVVLSDEDPYYSDFSMTCMEFVRSAPAPVCNFGPREQLNQITSFIDASVVYGAVEEQAKRLRNPDGKGELLMMMTPDGRELLPPSTDPRDGCNTPEMNEKGKYCFMSGDSRANENMHLTTMHLLLAREHNRIVRKLSQLNPTWDDEKLYQEGRRIVGAQIQHITYKEFLPVILGKSLMEKLNLDPEEEGYSYRYNPDVNPSVANNFATAAFRFAHTLLPTLMKVVNNDTSSEEYVELHKMLFNPYELYAPNKMESSINGALRTDIQRYDTYLTPELTQHLFQQRWTENSQKLQENSTNGKMKKMTGYGLDLASLNVQRGRDHGLPSYVKWRKFCGLSTPKAFADLRGQMDDSALQRLATLFKSVEDVDLYSGSLSEIPIGEGLLGPTFSCLIADQFVRLKFGDRYWYETWEQPQAFTPEQLQEIRKSSLAAIICDNSGVERAQPEVMRSIDATNQRVPCTSIPRMQLKAWQGQGKLGRVKIGTQYLQPKVMPKSMASAVSTFIKGTIISASITAKDSNGNSVTLLDSTSTFPKSLPLHLFDQMVNTTTFKPTNTSATPPAYTGPSVVSWTGALTLTDDMQAHAVGTYAAPYFVHGLTPFDFSMINYTGNFVIDMKLEKNASSLGLTSIQGTYNSGIHFRTESNFMASTLKTMGEDTGKGVTPRPQAPILLYGTYSLDGKSFDWNGNISLVIPPPSPTTLLTKTKGGSDSILVKANWGLVTATSGPTPAIDGDTKTVITKWWDGTFPVAIPQPAFDRVVYNDLLIDSSTDTKPESGITWSGSLSPKPGSITGEVQLNGSYSFPVFTHSPKEDSGTSIYAEKFWRGNFSFVLQPSMYDPRPLISSLSLLASGGQFRTPIFFRAENETLKMSLRGEAKKVGPIVPVILHGYTSIDKSVFFWSGNATIIIPDLPTNKGPDAIDNSPIMKEKASMESDDDMVAVSSYSIPLDVNVMSATVNLTVSTSPKVPSRNTSWNGEFPLTIPQPLFYRSTPPPTTSLSEIDIDDEYPYYTPLAKAGTYKGGVTWSNISAKMLNTSENEIEINGSFSFPIYYFGTSNTKSNKTKPIWTGPTIENWSGVFQTTLKVNTTSIGNETLSLFQSIISEGQFTSSIYFSEKKALTAYQGKSPSKPVDPMEIIIILRGSKSPNKTEFYWNGEATLLIPLLSLTGNKEKMQEAISITKKLSASSNSYFMGSVASGNILATSSKANVMLWSGELPLAIAMPAFDAVSPNAAVWKWPYTTPFYNGTGGVTWSGTITKSSGLQNRVSVKGDFTVPIFVHGNPSAFEVVEWTGDFHLEVDVNVNRTGSTMPVGQELYNSPIFFRDVKRNEGGEDAIVSEIKGLLGMDKSKSLGKGAWVKTTRAPLILWGNYSDDRKVFYWGGNISAVFPAAKNFLYSTASNVAREKAAVDKPETENRLRVPFKIKSGSLSVSSSVFPKKEFWDGNLPVAIPTSFFHHYGQLYLGGPLNGTMHFAPSDSLLNGAQMEGLVSIPVFTDSNVSTIIFHKWSGEFSLIVSFPDGVDYKNLIPSSGSFVCRTFLGVPDLDAETVLLADIRKEEPTVVDYMMDSLPEFSYTNAFRAPLVLLGEFSTDRAFFYWSGDAVLYVPQKLQSSSKRVGMNQLSLPMTSPLQSAAERKIIGTVTSGTISGGKEGDSATTLWEGSFPAAIHVPFFNEYSNGTEALNPSFPVPLEMKTGLTWELTSVTPTADGVQIQGTFAFPKFTHGRFGSYSVTLWKGDFSFAATVPGDQGTAKLMVGLKYSSAIHFQQTYDWSRFKLREENYLGSSLMQPTVQRSTIILKGVRQKSSFLWSGKFVIIFPWGA